MVTPQCIGTRTIAGRDYFRMLATMCTKGGGRRLTRGVQLVLLGLLHGGCRTPADIEADSQDEMVRDEGEIVGECYEHLTPMDAALEQRLGFRASSVIRRIAGAHDVALTWLDGSHATRLVIGINGAQAYFVRSRAVHASTAVGFLCTNHMALDVTLSLQTRDGRLDEDVKKARFVAYSADEAHGTVRIEADALRGDYEPVRLRPDRCLLAVEARILIGNDGSHGTLADVIGWSSCDGSTDAEPALSATGRWGTRWLHY